MQLGREGVFSASQASTSNNRTTATKTIHPELANVFAKSKGEIIRQFSFALDEKEKLKQDNSKQLQHNLQLERELLQAQQENNRQKREIIELYDRINVNKEYSAIMIAG